MPSANARLNLRSFIISLQMEMIDWLVAQQSAVKCSPWISLFALWLAQNGLRITNRGNLRGHAFRDPCLAQDILEFFCWKRLVIPQVTGQCFQPLKCF